MWLVFDEIFRAVAPYRKAENVGYFSTLSIFWCIEAFGFGSIAGTEA